MRHLLRGFRSGLSLFRKTPASAAAAVVALAMGLGFSTTMFGIVQGATRTLPVSEPEAVVAVTKGPDSATGDQTSVEDVRRWRERGAHIVAIEAFQSGAFNLGSAPTSDHEAPPERVSGVLVTSGTFDLLGVVPAAGRVFTDADGRSGAARVALLSDALWARRFNRSPTIVGDVLYLDGIAHTVIGVMPRGFGFPIRSDVWVPLTLDAPRGGLQAWGRLAAGVPHAAVETALAAGTVERLRVMPFTEIETPREVIAGLYVLLLAVSGVLVIACVNVAHLFLARAAARARDIAVQLALGANRSTLVLEHTGEALAFTTVACAAGLALAHAALRVFAVNTAHIIEAYWVRFEIDGPMFVWACSLAMVAATASALLPAWRAARTDIIQSIRDGSGATRVKSSRASRFMVTAQIGLACAMLALTMLLGRSALSLQQREWPFAADRVLSTNVSIPASVMADGPSRGRLLTALERELNAVPGGRGALTSVLPGRGAGQWTFGLDTSPGATGFTGTTAFTQVSPRYFDVLGAGAVRRRLLDAGDGPGAPLVAVVNESFVRRYSPDRDPLGRRFVIGEVELTIVGIVPDLMPSDIQDTRQDGVYGAITQLRPFAVRLLVAGDVTPRQLREAVDRVDRSLPLYETFTVRDAALRDKQVLTVLSGLFGLFGSGALIMTAIGLYGVMSMVVAIRTREFGIRLALGATRRDLASLVARQGGGQIIVGLAIGVAAGLGLTMVFSSAVEAITVNPVVIIAGVTASLSTAAVGALAVPTWTAMRINPVEALRAD